VGVPGPPSPRRLARRRIDARARRHRARCARPGPRMRRGSPRAPGGSPAHLGCPPTRVHVDRAPRERLGPRMRRLVRDDARRAARGPLARGRDRSRARRGEGRPPRSSPGRRRGRHRVVGQVDGVSPSRRRACRPVASLPPRPTPRPDRGGDLAHARALGAPRDARIGRVPAPARPVPLDLARRGAAPHDRGDRGAAPPRVSRRGVGGRSRSAWHGRRDADAPLPRRPPHRRGARLGDLRAHRGELGWSRACRDLRARRARVGHATARVRTPPRRDGGARSRPRPERAPPSSRRAPALAHAGPDDPVARRPASGRSSERKLRRLRALGFLRRGHFAALSSSSRYPLAAAIGFA
jgi:hypothetical protein